jgi:protein tyrosine phosphatase (PTP) superfamily phosphohydrolase (DUF442 family)
MSNGFMRARAWRFSMIGLVVIAAHAACAAPAPAPRESADAALSFRGARAVQPGLITGGQPDSASFAALAARGVRVVLDIRAGAEPRGLDERRVVEGLGMRYETLPVTDATVDHATFAAFRAQMAGADTTEMVVHCASGNRVGAVMIPWLVLDRGMSVGEADSVARFVGMRGEGLREKALEYVRAEKADEE